MKLGEKWVALMFTIVLGLKKISLMLLSWKLKYNSSLDATLSLIKCFITKNLVNTSQSNTFLKVAKNLFLNAKNFEALLHLVYKPSPCFNLLELLFFK